MSPANDLRATPAWMELAACRGLYGLMFPEEHSKSPLVEPRKVCAICPVTAECLEYGLEEKFGIWGGKSEKERRKLRKERGMPKNHGRGLPRASCGTHNGYTGHIRHQEKPCGACTDAHARYRGARDQERTIHETSYGRQPRARRRPAA